MGHVGQYGFARISRGEPDAGYDTDGIGASGGPERCPRGGPDVQYSTRIMGRRAGNLEIFSSHVRLTGLTAAIRVRVRVRVSFADSEASSCTCDPTLQQACRSHRLFHIPHSLSRRRQMPRQNCLHNWVSRRGNYDGSYEL